MISNTNNKIIFLAIRNVTKVKHQKATKFRGFLVCGKKSI